MTDMDVWNHDKYWADGHRLMGHSSEQTRQWIVKNDYQGGVTFQRAQEEADHAIDITDDFAADWVRDESNSYRGGLEEMRAVIPFIARWWRL